MENSELQVKYQKLANEYSKIRSHATVLKKAVLDEQSKILGLREIVKEQEQKIRKHDQEMESLTFRNEQLTKRIYVLQQELQTNDTKRGKKGHTEPQGNNFSVFDEELQKKIIENARLASSMADKEIELSNCKEKIEWLEERLSKIQTEFGEKSSAYIEEIERLKQELRDKKRTAVPNENGGLRKECERCKNAGGDEHSLSYWREEADRWRTECDVLRAKPESNEQLTEYYEQKMRDLIEAKQMAKSEAASLWADNDALKSRLEHAILEKGALESILEKSNEELHTTSENYRSQLDAMTEHLAAQNEKITRQCDEIEMLKHKLSQKK